MVEHDAAAAEVFARHSGLGDAQLGQRRIAPALDLVPQVEHRLAVAHQVKDLFHNDSRFLFACAGRLCAPAQNAGRAEIDDRRAGLACAFILIPAAGAVKPGRGASQRRPPWPLYLQEFRFPDKDAEWRFFTAQRMTCYDSFYPFQVLSDRGLGRLEFAPVTILYGGNGCGKTTALNVMAEALGLARDAAFNRTAFFPDYLRLCDDGGAAPPEGSRIITSDDVFAWILDLRALNDGIDRRREEVFARVCRRPLRPFPGSTRWRITSG